MKISFIQPAIPRSGTFVVGVVEGRQLTPTAAAVDEKCGGALARSMKASRFRGETGQAVAVLSHPALGFERLMLIGLGKAKTIDALRMQAVGGHVVAHLNNAGVGAAKVAVDKVKGCDLDAPTMAANMAYGMRLRGYRFDKYRTKEKKSEKPSLKTLGLMVEGAAAATKAFAPLEKCAEGVFFTRDLASEPANVMNPSALARQAETLEGLGVKVEILNAAQMRKLGMRALLGVAQGSAQPPRLAVMQWKGAPGGKGRRPIAFVGKGVTFDTGGISIKPSGSMEDMKYDMGGAAVVIGLMKTLAARKAKVNAVGVVGLVENMPSGSAQRPGDIVTSMSGQTIEVLNTDAEGRLVLADALWYCQDRFKPRAMIDLATLTGAIVIALGGEYAGLFSNNDALAKNLIAAGKAVGEGVWRLPLGEAYDKLLDCDIADVKNITGKHGAGGITAAQFLQRFVNNVPWAHIDIAGVTWAKKDTPTVPKGGTGFGVRLLERLVADKYEGR